MAAKHGSHDEGTDVTKGTRAASPTPGSDPPRKAATKKSGRRRNSQRPAVGNGKTHPEIAALTDKLNRFQHQDLSDLSDADTLATIGQMEKLTHMLQAQQAVLTAHLVDLRNEVQKSKERSTRYVRSGVMRDVAFHRGLNATRGRKVVDLAVDAPTQSPRIFELFTEGQATEGDLVIFFDETTLLTSDGRVQADSELADDAPYLGERELRHRLRFITAKLEPELTAERARKATEQRHVSVRPGPDSMSNLSALIPGASAMAIESILVSYAKSKRTVGDERTEAQIKADALTGIVIGWAEATGRVPRSFTAAHRIQQASHMNPPGTEPDADMSGIASLGTTPAGTEPEGTEPAHGRVPATAVGHGDNHAQTNTEPGPDDTDHQDVPGFAEVDQAREAFAAFLREPDGAPDQVGTGLHTRVGVQVNLVITDLAAFGIQDTPAEIFGLGPVPAPLARQMILTAVRSHAATLKRLYSDPTTGALVAMESRSRIFPDALANMIGLRDKFCRHPRCNSPIRQMDHITPHAAGGATSFSNGQATCVRHNLIKDSLGATTTPEPVGPDSMPCGTGQVTTTLASGAQFVSPARPFPHEDPSTIASGHYWEGYRAGRAFAESALADRESLASIKEEANFDRAIRLRKTAAHLADESAEITRLRSEQEREAEQLRRDTEDLDRRAAEWGRLRAALDEQLSETSSSVPVVELFHSATTIMVAGVAARMKLEARATTATAPSGQEPHTP
ncbi:MAG: hypothetical protein ACTIJJ_08940 [Galactobacter sp.]